MKKILALVIILTLLLTIGVFGVTIDFKDVQTKDWYYENLKDIVEKNIIVGYPDGTFKPDDDLKFEEFVKMVVVAVADKPIEMVQGQEWHQIYIDIAKENNYINEESTKFIGQNIDRNTMAEIIYNIISSKEDFKEYTAEEITYLNSKLTDLTNTDTKTLTISGIGIICGYPDGTFKPNASLRRCETVAIVSRLINKDKRLPVEINLTGIEPTIPTDIEDLPKVDLSHLYEYPTLSGKSIAEENKYYQMYGDIYTTDVVNDYIKYMELIHNRDYKTINGNAENYKKQLNYYLNCYKIYHEIKYNGLKQEALDYYISSNNQEMIDYVLYKNDYIEDFLDIWVQETIDNKVQVQAKFYTNADLIHSSDGRTAIRGILRIKYANNSNPINIKEELDLVQGDKEISNIYLNYNNIQEFKIGKWYDIEMDLIVVEKSISKGLKEKAKFNYECIYPIKIKEAK